MPVELWTEILGNYTSIINNIPQANKNEKFSFLSILIQTFSHFSQGLGVALSSLLRGVCSSLLYFAHTRPIPHTALGTPELELK